MRATVITAAASLLASALPLAAQSVDPETVRATPGQEVRLGYFATFKGDCTSGPAPDIKITIPQSHGIIRMQNAMMGTKKIPNCTEVRGPAHVVFYKPSPGFSGSDSVSFDVINPATGRPQSHVVTIIVSN